MLLEASDKSLTMDFKDTWHYFLGIGININKNREIIVIIQSEERKEKFVEKKINNN